MELNKKQTKKLAEILENNGAAILMRPVSRDDDAISFAFFTGTGEDMKDEQKGAMAIFGQAFLWMVMHEHDKISEYALNFQEWSEAEAEKLMEDVVEDIKKGIEVNLNDLETKGEA